MDEHELEPVHEQTDGPIRRTPTPDRRTDSVFITFIRKNIWYWLPGLIGVVLVPVGWYYRSDFIYLTLPSICAIVVFVHYQYRQDFID